jgi:pyruvate dehydrogenase E1 component alpha subunit
MPGITADGNDVLAVYSAAVEAVERARNGEGPTLVHLETYRFGGHFVGDAEEYRTKEEVAGRRDLDPIPRLEALLVSEGVLTEEACARVLDEVAAEVAEAERFAEESPYPEAAEALEGVFT